MEFMGLFKMNDQDIMTAIQKNGFYIDQVEKTPERCLAAVRQNGLALQLIPKDIHSVALCLEAVKQNASAIKYVSRKIITNDICLEAVRSDGTVIAYSTYIPDEFRTKNYILMQ